MVRKKLMIGLAVLTIAAVPMATEALAAGGGGGGGGGTSGGSPAGRGEYFGPGFGYYAPNYYYGPGEAYGSWPGYSGWGWGYTQRYRRYRHY